jgi:hypothetical protein
MDYQQESPEGKPIAENLSLKEFLSEGISKTKTAVKD